MAENNHLNVPLAAPRMRIGLLGGSFNPAHGAHRQISLTALKRLGLDQVWWLVTPGNPLKDGSGQPKLEKRVVAARATADHPRIVVTGFEDAIGSPYTIDTLRFLMRRYPDVRFVWLMGADNLASFDRWREWDEIFKLMPVAVFDRPGYGLRALAGKAAQRFAANRKDDSDALGLAMLEPPAWIFLTTPLSALSSTALRSAGAKTKSKKPKKPAGKKVKKAAAKPDKKATKKAATKSKPPAKKASKAALKGRKPTKAAAKKGKPAEAKKPAKAVSKNNKKPKKKAKRH